MKRFRLVPIAAVLLFVFAFTLTAHAQQANPLFPGDAPLQDYRVYIQKFYQFSVAAGILIATVLIMIGGMIWVTSAGNPGRIDKAKSYILDSIIGVILLVSAYTILQVINPGLVRVPAIDARLKLGETGACVYQRDGKQYCGTSTRAECVQENWTPDQQRAVGHGPGEFVQDESCVDICAGFSEDGTCTTRENIREAQKGRFDAELAGLNQRHGACNAVITGIDDETFSSDNAVCLRECKKIDIICALALATETDDKLTCQCQVDQALYEAERSQIQRRNNQ